MTNLKTKYIKVRMTPEEQAMLKKRLKEENMTIAYYVRSAMAEYSNVDARQRLELINDLVRFTESSGMNYPGQVET